MSSEKVIWDYFKAKGLNDYACAGVLGNLKAESGLSPTNLQNTYNAKLGMSDAEYTAAVDNGSYTNFVNDSGGYGLAQWTFWTRKQNLYNFAQARGTSIGDLSMQLDFLYKELTENYCSALYALRAATSVLEASNVMLLKFEKPADQSEAVQKKRASYAQTYYEKYASQIGGIDMTAVQELLATAKAEVGYLEKATNSQLDSKTANAGRNNYTKYARDLDALGIVYNTKKNGYAWCDMFCDWCFIKTFGLETAMKMLNQSYKGLGAGCTYSANYFRSAGRFYTSNPQPGDQIFFKSGNEMTHTGIVYAVDDKYVYTIEGNTSSAAGVVANGGAVAEKYYSLNYSKIGGYGRPDYSLAEVISEGWVDNESGRWYRNGDGTYPAAEWKYIDGSYYYFNAEGYMVSNKIIAGEGSFAGYYYYCGEDGKVVTNTTIVVNGVTYRADSLGRLFDVDDPQPPERTDTVPDMYDEEDDNMSYDKFKEFMNQYRAELQSMEGSAWSKDARDWSVQKGLIQGGSTEEFNGMWCDLITREAFITVMKRYAEMIGQA